MYGLFIVLWFTCFRDQTIDVQSWIAFYLNRTHNDDIQTNIEDPDPDPTFNLSGSSIWELNPDSGMDLEYPFSQGSDAVIAT